MKKEKIAVLSLGGSMINGKNGLDTEFLKKFKAFILQEIKNGYRFVIVCGGGRVCREYQDAARAVGLNKSSDLDWIGIHTTHFNANFMKGIFGKLSHSEIVRSESDKFKWTSKLLFSGGWVPGHSTDFDAVVLAKRYGAKTVINLSNIEYVFDKDPNKFKDAVKIEKISWKDFRKIVGNKWAPGANAPFDPIASREAEKNKFKVVVMNGKNLGEVSKVLKGEDKIIGTIIS
ncbi:MAG: UMP kinase [Candidatus Magasanikbacteria bacterium]|nr:UMP kinase [Candidatus Magasanikbacteria bacterium]